MNRCLTPISAAMLAIALTGLLAAGRCEAQTTASDSEEGFADLLAGDPAKTWRGYAKDEWPAGWEVKDGALHRIGGGSDIMTKDTFRSFDLRFEWKISKAGNSGVMYRVGTGDPQPYFSGPEYQVLDNDEHPDGKLETHRAGALYDLIAPAKKAVKPVGQWNAARIVIDGNRVEHYLNGEKVVATEFDGPEWKKLVAASKFKDWERFGKVVDGHIDFQDHGDEVWYRKIRIKRLDEKK